MNGSAAVGPYRAPWWLPGGHLQTLYAALLAPRPRVTYRRERWETPDGDFVDLDWVLHRDAGGGIEGAPTAPLVVLFHGLEGGSTSHYAHALMALARDRGWRGVVIHFRGCSGEANRLPRAYHSGDSDEIDWMLRRLRESSAGALYATGVSLGGNALLKWLGERGRAAGEVVTAAAATSAPLDLMAAGDALGRGFNLVYTKAFLRSLKRKSLAKLARHPQLYDRSVLRAARTLRAFDNVVTAPLHGFRDTDDYWTRSSSKPLLSRIIVPTLVVNARNDPFMPARALPGPAEVAPAVTCEFPREGGHVGFVSGTFPGHLEWLPRRIIAFLQRNNEEVSMSAAPTGTPVPPEIFKAYDIRGIVKTALTPEVTELIGRAIGSEGRDRGVKAVVIGRDGRLSGPALAAALARGIQAAGLDVIDIGQVATPMTYFAAHQLETQSGVSVTGSHNPPEYNGLKIVLAGETLAGEAIQALRQRIETGNLASGNGSYSTHDIREAYLQRIVSDVKLSRPVNLIVDCGNGVPGATAPELYRRLGCTVKELYCEVDGNFPNHHPDPSHVENLNDLIAALKTEGEIGFAFDGDGDRLGVVTKSGKIIFPDRQLMLFAADVLSRNPGAEIIFDVKSTRNLYSWIESRGGKATMWKTGHSFIKQKLKETGAPLAGEMSGHTFFKERWYGFDDAMYAGARLLEILSREQDVSAVLENLPDAISTPELQLKTAEGENYTLIDTLKKNARFEGAKELITIDGLRVEYPDGFGLARPSNTTPVVVLRFEADNEQALARIKEDFRRALLAVKPGAALPF